ncbi:MAG: aspartate kinase [Candidatus Tyrphobacter sp.]
MSASVAVLKFGGTSLADREKRALARRRVREAMEQGHAVVAVVSAMGRAPNPYATDSLLALLGDSQTRSRNADLLLATGETISAAVFAAELEIEGTACVALTGAQAGIVTDERFGDATIRRVESEALRALLDDGIVAVVAGFQGASESGLVVTLGRGGTDLSAVAIGHALGAQRVDIYTDVSGVMTADPRRLPEARTIAHATHEEVAELAQHGAKVMHYKAAEYARRTKTPYTILGLQTDRGTLVQESVAHHRAVTGVALSSALTWVRVIRGDIENPTKRMETELEMFARIAKARISIDQVTINQAGVAFVVEGERGNEVRRLLGDLNLAVRVREGCAKLSVVGEGMREEPGVIHELVSALAQENVEIIHCTDSNVTISVLVPAPDGARAEAAAHRRFSLDVGDPVA